MKSRLSKMVAPVIIVAIICMYYVALVIVLFLTKIPSIFKVTIGLISIIVSSLFVFVLAERIKEIRKGEEDDLSKY